MLPSDDALWGAAVCWCGDCCCWLRRDAAAFHVPPKRGGKPERVIPCRSSCHTADSRELADNATARVLRSGPNPSRDGRGMDEDDDEDDEDDNLNVGCDDDSGVVAPTATTYTTWMRRGTA